MKKEVILLLILFSITLVSADTCDLGVSLINQDPYPAVPGDYVKLVFQVDGINSAQCGDITFELLGDYPIEFNPGETNIKFFKKVDYLKDYASTILVPYNVRINEDALDGSNPVEVSVTNSKGGIFLNNFNVEVEDVRTDFEIYVKDYDYLTNTLTIEVMNIDSSNIEALTLEIPKQDNIVVKGSNKQVVGDLDSNEYTTADFEATVKDGNIEIKLTYSDSINVRRTLIKTIVFDSTYFTGRIADQKTTSTGTYIVVGAIFLLIIYWIYKKIRNRKKKKN